MDLGEGVECVPPAVEDVVTVVLLLKLVWKGGTGEVNWLVPDPHAINTSTREHLHTVCSALKDLLRGGSKFSTDRWLSLYG